MIERGVRPRTIYLDSARNDGPTLDYAYWLSDLGGEVRTVPTLPLRMVIVDRQVAVVPNWSPAGDDLGVLMRQRLLHPRIGHRPIGSISSANLPAHN